MTTIVFPLKNLIMYMMLSGSFLCSSASSTISLCPKGLHLRESSILNGEVGDLFLFESLQILFDGLTRVLSSSCETASFIT